MPVVLLIPACDEALVRHGFRARQAGRRAAPGCEKTRATTEFNGKDRAIGQMGRFDNFGIRGGSRGHSSARASAEMRVRDWRPLRQGSAVVRWRQPYAGGATDSPTIDVSRQSDRIAPRRQAPVGRASAVLPHSSRRQRAQGSLSGRRPSRPSGSSAGPWQAATPRPCRARRGPLRG